MIKNKHMIAKQLLARLHAVILHLVCMKTQFGPIALPPLFQSIRPSSLQPFPKFPLSRTSHHDLHSPSPSPMITNDKSGRHFSHLRQPTTAESTIIHYMTIPAGIYADKRIFRAFSVPAITRVAFKHRSKILRFLTSFFPLGDKYPWIASQSAGESPTAHCNETPRVHAYRIPPGLPHLQHGIMIIAQLQVVTQTPHTGSSLLPLMTPWVAPPPHPTEDTNERCNGATFPLFPLSLRIPPRDSH